jgi:hypothetical protein
MKKVFFLLLVHVYLFIAVTAFADPRMETNNNFCHFILDTNNTDNEVFVAGCDSIIAVVENIEKSKSTSIQCDRPYLASGYAKVQKMMPQTAAPLLPGETLRFTSTKSSDIPCTMVESNGRQYTSYIWKSTITVRASNQNGFVNVVYELFCQDGQ